MKKVRIFTELLPDKSSWISKTDINGAVKYGETESEAYTKMARLLDILGFKIIN